MPMTDRTRAQLQIHFCVLLWGFTAILGKLITLPALRITFPDPVAFDEAIELAKRFGSADSPAFVNGVLDQIRRAAAATPSTSDSVSPPDPTA